MREYLILGLAIALILICLYFIYQYKQKSEQLDEIMSNIVTINDEMKKTLLSGLYNRFKREEGTEESPLDFEKFVASILEIYYGGTARVTKGSGDFGVDIELNRKTDMILGQVKCYAEEKKLNYEPIAILHSQMVKQNVKEGFVVTTSDFSQYAREYAMGLKIRLINGSELIEIIVKAMDNQTYRAKKLLEIG